MSSHYLETELTAVATLECRVVAIASCPSDDARDLWNNSDDCLRPQEIFAQCEKVLRKLQMDSHVKYIADVDIPNLREAIANWQEKDFNVYKDMIEFE